MLMLVSLPRSLGAQVFFPDKIALARTTFALKAPGNGEAEVPFPVFSPKQTLLGCALASLKFTPHRDFRSKAASFV